MQREKNIAHVHSSTEWVQHSEAAFKGDVKIDVKIPSL